MNNGKQVDQLDSQFSQEQTIKNPSSGKEKVERILNAEKRLKFNTRKNLAILRRVLDKNDGSLDTFKGKTSLLPNPKGWENFVFNDIRNAESYAAKLGIVPGSKNADGIFVKLNGRYHLVLAELVKRVRQILVISENENLDQSFKRKIEMISGKLRDMYTTYLSYYPTKSNKDGNYPVTIEGFRNFMRGYKDVKSLKSPYKNLRYMVRQVRNAREIKNLSYVRAACLSDLEGDGLFLEKDKKGTPLLLDAQKFSVPRRFEGKIRIVDLVPREFNRLVFVVPKRVMKSREKDRQLQSNEYISLSYSNGRYKDVLGRVYNLKSGDVIFTKKST